MVSEADESEETAQTALRIDSTDSVLTCVHRWPVYQSETSADLTKGIGPGDWCF